MRRGQVWALPMPEIIGIVATILVLTIGLGLFGGVDILGATQTEQAKNQFDAFTTEISETCRAIGNTGELRPLGNEAYNFSAVIQITRTDTTLIAEGDGFSHRKTIQECGAVTFCEPSSTQDCGLTRIEAGRSMRFEFYKPNANEIRILPVAAGTGQTAGSCGGEPPSGVTGGCYSLGQDDCQAVSSCTWAGSPGTAAGGCNPSSGNVCEDVNDLDDPRETCIEIGCEWTEG